MAGCDPDRQLTAAIGNLVRAALLSGRLSDPACDERVSYAYSHFGRNAKTSPSDEDEGVRPVLVQRQPSVMAYRARAIISFRAKVATIAPVPMTDPIQDALLQLYVAEEEQTEIAVSAIGPLIRVAQTTWLRYMLTMEQAGLIVRTNDPNDKRRCWLTLSRDCKAKLDEFISDFW